MAATTRGDKLRKQSYKILSKEPDDNVPANAAFSFIKKLPGGVGHLMNFAQKVKDLRSKILVLEKSETETDKKDAHVAISKMIAAARAQANKLVA